MYTVFGLHIYLHCRPEEGTRSHHRWCEPSYGGWELNSGPLEEQTVLLTPEPSPQAPKTLILKIKLFFYVNMRRTEKAASSPFPYWSSLHLFPSPGDIPSRGEGQLHRRQSEDKGRHLIGAMQGRMHNPKVPSDLAPPVVGMKNGAGSRWAAAAFLRS